MNLSILYRGPLSSCNYACGYCPFAKRTESAAELAHDRACLERFVGWVGGRSADAIGVLFTPWGEALVRPWYQDALASLTRWPHVRKAAIQTNLSCKLDWLDACDRTRLALWCTFHPAETTRERFLAKCRDLYARGVRFSVGVVGLEEHFADISALRRELPADVYLWVNAYKREPDYYAPEAVEELTRIDPLFPINNRYHPSRGEPCRAGNTVISVDGDGTVRRCHFVKAPIGNLYAADFEGCLAERPCPNETCGCHIGYVHLDRLGLYERFGNGVLERVPVGYR
jgi:MoaA/NifB/PqqE/SkfB family radical SAM enzyme